MVSEKVNTNHAFSQFFFVTEKKYISLFFFFLTISAIIRQTRKFKENKGVEDIFKLFIGYKTNYGNMGKTYAGAKPKTKS